MIRRESMADHTQALLDLAQQLYRSSQRVLTCPVEVAKALSQSADLSKEQIVDYWQNIDYRLQEEHVEGLKLFFQLCKKHNLLTDNPPLEFFGNNLPDEAIIS